MCRSWDETYCSNPLATLNLILDLSLAIDAWSDHPFKIQLLVGGSITSAMHLNQKPSAPTRSSKTLVNRSLQRLKKNITDRFLEIEKVLARRFGSVGVV